MTSQFSEMWCDSGDDNGVPSLEMSTPARNTYYQEGPYNQYAGVSTAANSCGDILPSLVPTSDAGTALLVHKGVTSFGGYRERYRSFAATKQQKIDALFTSRQMQPIVNNRSYTLEHAFDEDLLYKKAVSKAEAARTGLTVGTAPVDPIPPTDLGPAEPVPVRAAPDMPAQDSPTKTMLCPLRCGESLPLDSDHKTYGKHIEDYHAELYVGVEPGEKVACPVPGCGMKILVHYVPRHFSSHVAERRDRAHCMLCARSFKFRNITKHVKLENHTARLEERRDSVRGSLPELNYSVPGLDSKDIPGRPYVRWLMD